MLHRLILHSLRHLWLRYRLLHLLLKLRLLLGLLLLLEEWLQQCCHLSNRIVYRSIDSLCYMWVDSLTRIVPDCRLVLIILQDGMLIHFWIGWRISSLRLLLSVDHFYCGSLIFDVLWRSIGSFNALSLVDQSLFNQSPFNQSLWWSSYISSV